MSLGYVKSSTLLNERKQGALTSGALERPFGPICAILALFSLWRQMAVPLIFSLIQNSRRFYVPYQKMKDTNS